MDKYSEYILIGIDEVGRGPLAGPVAVGVFILKNPLQNNFRKIFRGVKESKQLSEAKREEWFSLIKKAKSAGLVDFSVEFQSANKIDSSGLTQTINKAMERGLKNIVTTKRDLKKYLVLLDGGLHAPAHFPNQKTIIRGDEKETVIALASICAKVLRDRKMKTCAKKYPKYGFEIHKGYGTRAHIAAIRKYGVSPLHRHSFLKKLL